MSQRSLWFVFGIAVIHCLIYPTTHSIGISPLYPENNTLWEQENCETKRAEVVRQLEAKNISFCPVYFDGIACWGPVPANSTQYMPCPTMEESEVIMRTKWEVTIDKKPSDDRYSMRACKHDGTWTSNKTDYGRCIGIKKSFKEDVNIIYLVGNSLSFISLNVAVGIFMYFKNLMCLRNKIHCHFFLSISLRIITFFFLYAFNTSTYNNKSVPVCYFLLSMSHFSGLAKYFWMLAEGFYLVLVIIWTFGSERLRLWNFGVGAWGVPFILTMIWLIVRNAHGYSCYQTGNQEDAYKLDWFINGPIILSLVINLCMAIFIAKTLLTKLQDTQRLQHHVSRNSRIKEIHCPSGDSHNEDNVEKSRLKERKRQILAVASVHRKAMKSILILIPLLGLTYIVFLLPPHESFKRPWRVINAVLSSTQGFFVALLFCFLNHEVQNAVRAAYQAWKDRRGITRYTYGRTNSLFGDHVNTYRRQSSPSRPLRANAVTLTDEFADTRRQ